MKYTDVKSQLEVTKIPGKQKKNIRRLIKIETNTIEYCSTNPPLHVPEKIKKNLPIKNITKYLLEPFKDQEEGKRHLYQVLCKGEDWGFGDFKFVRDNILLPSKEYLIKNKNSVLIHAMGTKLDFNLLEEILK